MEQYSAGPSTGWNGLPLECLEIIVQVLDHDTTTLSSLLQVNRQCFFLVVPQLYRDPFQRILDLATCHKNRIRICSSDKEPLSSTSSLSPTTTTLSMDPQSHFVDSVVKATTIPYSPKPNVTIDQAARTKAKFKQDLADINTILTTRLNARELHLLTTLSSTLIQQLCVRFPRLHRFYFKPPTSNLFDFGPYYEQVQWTNECYLRHLSGLDLEKLSARGRRRGGPEGVEFLACVRGSRDLAPTTGKEGVFQRHLSPRLYSELCCIGVLDYLQRAILNIPGADRIQSLRVPAHRMKTLQQRHDRVPRRRLQKEPQQQNAECEKNSTESSDNTHEQESTNDIQANDGTRSSGDIGNTLKPYCFTFKKLTSLRRLEVCYMTGNDCDWETLDRVLETLQSSHHPEKSVSVGESM
ncbi:hypothetical protein BGZ65_002355, partial [Modicella reniformis]